MDLNVLPLAEIDLKIGDDAIKFDNEDKQDLSQINPSYSPETFDLKNGLHFIKQEVENYEDVNLHVLTNNHRKSDSNNSERRYHCEDCGKSFIRNEHLKNHRRTHTGERPYECEFCQRSFAKNFDLSRHKQYVHGFSKTFFSCEECSRTFSRKDHLQAHLMFHKNQALKSNETNDVSTPLDRFVCKTCGRTYCRVDNLKKHMEKHCENIDSTNCDSKDGDDDLKSEAITGNMQKGINFHFLSANEPTALRPFACKFCGRLFVRKDHLVNHERTHTGEKPYHCEQCDRRFAKRFVLTRHLQNVHRVMMKVYNCSECDKKYTRTDHLKKHMESHFLAAIGNPQKDKIHKCDICGGEFTRSDNLKTHMKIHLLAEVKKRQEEEEMTNSEHENELEYFCDTNFPDFDELQKHEQKHLKMETS